MKLIDDLIRIHRTRRERFTVKGWHWWPAHWRGDVTLGTVHKDYQLVGEQ